MKSWLFLFLFFALPARAEVIAAAGVQLDFATAADGRSISTNEPFVLRAGCRFQYLDVYLEFENYTASDGGPGLYVSTQHQEWLTWARYMFTQKSRVAPYVAVGAGVEIQRVETDLGDQVSKESGAPVFETAAATGLRINVWSNLDVEFEGRLTSASDLAPNPMFGLGALVGWSFR